MARNISLFGLPIIRVKRTENREKRYFLGIRYRTKCIKTFADVFATHVRGIRDRRIRIIINNLGEPVVFARTSPFWYRNNELLFGTLPPHIEIFHMLAPSLPIFYCPRAQISESLTYAGNTLIPLIFDEELYAFNKQRKPFFQSWSEYLHADFSSLTYSRAIVSPDAERSALLKAAAINLNMDNFVFLAPGSTSCTPLELGFWEGVELALRAMGLDVLYNCPAFSLTETYVLASRARAIVALRSGLLDLLCEINIPQFVIYTPCPIHDDILPMYTLRQFPWAASRFINEFDTNSRTIPDIRAEILSQMKNLLELSC